MSYKEKDLPPFKQFSEMPITNEADYENDLKYKVPVLYIRKTQDE